MHDNADSAPPREVVIDGVRYVPAGDEVKVIKANPCRACCASAADCERIVRRTGRGCCNACYQRDTHGMTLADWAAFRSAFHIDRNAPVKGITATDTP